MKKNIVLVVGAGASKDIDPEELGVGKELRQNIIQRVTDNHTKEKNLSIKLNSLGFDKEIRNRFSSDLDQGGDVSIDAFLNRNRANKKYQRIGEFSVAFHILGGEASCLRNGGLTKRSWLNELNNFIINHRLHRWGDHDIDFKIVTFNYDRLIEEFLFRQHGQIIDQFAKESIIHTYGKMGDLPWQADKYIEFGHRNDDWNKLQGLQGKFQLIKYKKKNDPNIKKVKKLLKAAHEVLFLGYGFDTFNNKNLGLTSTKPQKRKFLVNLFCNAPDASSFKNFKMNSRAIKRMNRNSLVVTESCVDFLRKYLEQAANDR